MGCLFRTANEYDVFLFKIVSPFVIVALLWTYPLWCYLRSNFHQEAWQNAARFSVLFLELVLPMISTR